MSGTPDERREPPESASAEGRGLGGGAPPAGAPPLLHYVYLNLGVWAFLAATFMILAAALGSERGLALFGIIIGVGFTLVSAFDYCWMRFRGRGE